MARPPGADMTVYIVDDAGQADQSVAVVDGIHDLSPAEGDVIQFHNGKWINSPTSGIFVPANYQLKAEKGVADGYASLDGSGTVPDAQLPAAIARDSEVTAAVAAEAVLRAAADSGLQPLDSDLTAIAALATTSFGRSLLTQADAAATRTTLGLGTAATHATGDYDAAGAAAAAQAASQPLDSDLTAIAALATTAFGRSLLAAADAAALRTLAALGTAATSATGDFIASTLPDAKGDLLTATANDTPARLAVGADGTALVADSTAGTGLAWKQRSRVLAESHADAGAASSSAEQTLATLTIPGGILAAGDLLRVMATGDMFNNAGSVIYTLRVKIGGTTVLSGATTIAQVATNRRKWVWYVDIYMESAAAERVGAMWDPSTAVSSSFAPLQGANGLRGYGTAAEDTATAKDVVLTSQMDTSNSLCDMILHASSLTLLKK